MTRRPIRTTLLGTSLLAGLALIAAGPAPPPQEYAGEPPAWTVEDCAVCHEDVVSSMAGRPHEAPVDSSGGWTAETSCIACHGDPTEHFDSGGDAPMKSLADASTLELAETCGSCHGDTHPRFLTSQHARAGVDCASCHTIHGELASGAAGRAMLPIADRGVVARLDGISASCAECHADVAHDFELNERHRLEEGILTCVSCHDPHDRSASMRLGAFKHENACIDCHTDKGGPFIFEHGSARVEGCTACHTPHGSVNRHMLTFQATGDLCYSCHATVPGFHAGSPLRFDSATNCTNCHSAIHGSNLDPFFLK